MLKWDRRSADRQALGGRFARDQTRKGDMTEPFRLVAASPCLILERSGRFRADAIALRQHVCASVPRPASSVLGRRNELAE